MTALIKLTSAGANTGPFDLYSDTDNYTVPFATGITKDQLLIGYLTTAVLSTVTNIKIISTGGCDTIIDVPAPLIKLSCHNVRYGPGATDCDVYWINCDDTPMRIFVSAGAYLNIQCARNNTWSGCGPFVIQDTCITPTTTTTTTKNIITGPTTNTTTTRDPALLDCYVLKQGAGKHEFTIDLSPEGGLITLSLRQELAPVKFEILHNGVKKATSGTFYGNGNIFNPNLTFFEQSPTFTVFNSGPFDDSGDLRYYYYNHSVYFPNTNIPGGLAMYPQYIWNGFTGGYTPSGYFNATPIYSRQAEYTAETGSTLLLAKNIDGIGVYSGRKINFDQLMWWKYTSDDYTLNPKITVRITTFGRFGGWQIVRSC